MNKPYYPPFSTLSENQKDKYTSDLKELELYFIKEFGLSIYLAYGTLLGAIRDNDYILHDVDIDLGYLSSYTIESDVYSERLILKQKLINNNLLRSLNTMGLKIRFNNNDFDVWTSWINKSGQYMILPFANLCAKEIVLPLKQIIFREKQFLIPQNSEELLDKIYVNWKIPLTTNYLKKNIRFNFLS